MILASQDSRYSCMRTLALCWVLCVCALMSFGQEPEADSLTVQEANLEIGNPLDTIRPFLFLPIVDLEFIPADETPELIADRLSCLEQTVPLTYNDKTQAFINYFVVKDREYTKMVLRRKDLYFPLFEKYFKKYNLPDELKYLSIIQVPVFF